MQFWVEVWERVSSHKTLAIWLFASFLLALTGPFGTYDTMSTGLRLIYWPGLSALSVVMGLSILILTHPLRKAWPEWCVQVLRVAIYTVLFTPILRFVTLALVPDEPLQDKPRLVLYAIVCAVATAILTLQWAFDKIDPQRDPLPDQAPLPRLLRRLPDGTSGDIVRLSVNDHYVHVFLSTGEMHRILMRLSDAIDEMDLVEGLCTHRSHWVARRYIGMVRRERSRDILTLTNGDEVPVGRKYRPNLVAAGLIDPTLSGEGNGEAAAPSEDRQSSGTEERV